MIQALGRSGMRERAAGGCLKRLAVSVCLFAGVPGLAAVPTKKPLLLITAFDPFNKADVNESLSVAREIAAQAKNFVAQVCIIPTQYAKSGPEALKCLKGREKPAAMLGMGEGGCLIELETRAQNVDKASIADNAGEIRDGKPIAKNGDAYVALGFPVDGMLRSLDADEKKRVAVSGDPGSFVCNHVAYEMGEQYRKKKIPTYGFIHVPNHKCAAEEKNAAENARLIVKMLEGTLFPDNGQPAAESGNRIGGGQTGQTH